MIEHHLSRKIVIIRNNSVEEYNLAVITLDRDENEKIVSFSMDTFKSEQANVLYHDCDLVLKISDDGEILLNEQGRIVV